MYEIKVCSTNDSSAVKLYFEILEKTQNFIKQPDRHWVNPSSTKPTKQTKKQNKIKHILYQLVKIQRTFSIL